MSVLDGWLAEAQAHHVRPYLYYSSQYQYIRTNNTQLQDDDGKPSLYAIIVRVIIAHDGFRIYIQASTPRRPTITSSALLGNRPQGHIRFNSALLRFDATMANICTSRFRRERSGCRPQETGLVGGFERLTRELSN